MAVVMIQLLSVNLTDRFFLLAAANEMLTARRPPKQEDNFVEYGDCFLEHLQWWGSKRPSSIQNLTRNCIISFSGTGRGKGRLVVSRSSYVVSKRKTASRASPFGLLSRTSPTHCRLCSSHSRRAWFTKTWSFSEGGLLSWLWVPPRVFCSGGLFWLSISPELVAHQLLCDWLPPRRITLLELCLVDDLSTILSGEALARIPIQPLFPYILRYHKQGVMSNPWNTYTSCCSAAAKNIFGFSGTFVTVPKMRIYRGEWIENFQAAELIISLISIS